MTGHAHKLAGEAAAATHRLRLEISGTVQGVGFRPFLYRLARAHGLAGFAMNADTGVTAEIEGPPGAVEDFITDVRRAPPPHAIIRGIATRAVPLTGSNDFQLRESIRVVTGETSVLPDLATCDACLTEIFDPTDRRYLYPFTNCTDCGPRFSLIEALPYDRDRTSMRHFVMCPTCGAEYLDPASRRFHAEPNACPDCGPRLELRDGERALLADRHAALQAAAAAIRSGQIVAVKGLGGFHLMVDAGDEAAVQRLRDRKMRQQKPFALMFPNIDSIRGCCAVSEAEANLLSGRERPITLLRRNGTGGIAEGVAPGNPRLGAMLPYTPLHHILMAELDSPVVATSGNLSDEPIVTGNDEALQRLSGIADLFLLHNRPIVRPVDDSIARLVRGKPMLIRRARGYAPQPVAVDAALESGILGTGGNLKAAIGISHRDGVIISQHLGDLDTPEARHAYDGMIESLTSLHGTRLRQVACDMHPDYYATRAAEATGLPLTRVQHHLAHVASVMAEHALEPPILGVAWDGTGYGTDGTIWGGEFLQVNTNGWNRVAHLRPFRLPGGTAAIREPRRALVGLLYEFLGEGMEDYAALPGLASFSATERRVLRTMIATGVNAPLTTSAGRLFDGIAALAGLSPVAAYEAQAACQLEWAADINPATCVYEFPVLCEGPGPWIVDWGPALGAMLQDVVAGVAVGAISAGFHNGLAVAIAMVARQAGARRVALSGGCFQNALLLEHTIDALEKGGRDVFRNAQVPANDGGLALGQLWWAARQGETSCA
ncbi:MAG: carbamoyltransferase HypF [Alphaproteobacteria bacterium]